MRAGGSGYTVQQPLTFESTSLVKQAIALARRRGHGQVTPLHVATTMLSASNGIFRTACLQSHSHPLQCKALELCFNVELNRLPVSSSSPMRPSVAPQSQHPTISNALVAAFKRAQANQRRGGSMENQQQQQQQPLLVVNIELEQLIVSILDDPSVSRVMREAGFLSTQVKSNIEHEQVQGVFLDQASNSPTNLFKEHNLLDTTKTLVSDYAKEEDVASVLEGLIKRKTSIVVVGECLVTLEKIVKDVKDKFEKGDVPEELKEVKFISIPFSFVNRIDNHEIKEKLDVLGRLVKDVYAKRVVLYVGDFNQWMIHYKNNSIVEHVIEVLGKMVYELNRENGMCWLLGISTFATYTRCTNSNHLLQNLWGLHPIMLPSGTLGLSLSTEREAGNDSRSVCNSNSTLSCLPSWLKDECTRLEHNHKADEICKKQNSVSGSIHKESPEKSSNFSSTIAYDSISSYDQQLPNSPSPHSHGNLQFNLSPSTNDNMNATTLNMQEPNLTFSSFSNTSLNSGGSSSEIAEIDYYIPRFKQFNSENLRIMCNALEQKFPWQKHIVPEICTTILQCRSGMLRRKDTNSPDDIRANKKEETWLLFYGPDSQAKEIFARELSKVVFGSYSNFVSISLRSFSSTRAYSDDEGFRNKRRRDEQGFNHVGMIAHAISENPHRVIFVEDLMEGDMCSQLHIKRAIESGKIGEELMSLGDAIIIFCCESFNNTSVVESRKKIQWVNLDLNISFDEEHVFENKSEGEMGIVESVDGFIVFRQHELYEDLRL